MKLQINQRQVLYNRISSGVNRRIARIHRYGETFWLSSHSLYRKLIVQNPKTPRDGVVIVYTTNPGSVGDDAMFRATVSMLVGKGCTKIAMIRPSENDQFDEIDGISEVFEYPQSIRGWRRLKEQLLPYKALGLIAADTIDGVYSQSRSIQRLRIVKFANDCGLQATCLGFSFRDDPTNDIVSMIRRMNGVTMCCRDPLSLDRFQRITGMQGEQVADLAFLLKPKVITDHVSQLIAQLKEFRLKGFKIVAINANAQAGPLTVGENYMELVKSFSIAISKFSDTSPDCRFLFIPHDSRGKFSDVNLATSIYDELSDSARDKTLSIVHTRDPREIRAICESLDFALTGRMHFGILCLAACIPIAATSYQQKFEGLFQLLNLRMVDVGGHDAFDADKIADALSTLYSRHQSDRIRLREAIPELEKLAESQIHHLYSGNEHSTGM
ncbi:polysaccharide pyruvyl transferase family protein [Akkermansiaceae bacterium]|nr:polysaccharide pyruvyl transferase family protein [Akkermansiaceae bacterium]